MEKIEYNFTDLFGRKLSIGIEVCDRTKEEHQLLKQLDNEIYTLLLVVEQLGSIEEFVKQKAIKIHGELDFIGLVLFANDDVVMLIAPRPVEDEERKLIIDLVCENSNRNENSNKC